MKKLRYLLLAWVVLGVFGGTGTAADYQSMATEELSAIRGTLQDATEEEQQAFHSEWTSRLEQMTPEERASYSNAGPGKGNGLQDGSGNGPGDGSGSGAGPGNGSGNGSGPGDGSGRGNSENNGPGGGNGNRGGGGGGGGRR